MIAGVRNSKLLGLPETEDFRHAPTSSAVYIMTCRWGESNIKDVELLKFNGVNIYVRIIVCCLAALGVGPGLSLFAIGGNWGGLGVCAI